MNAGLADHTLPRYKSVGENKFTEVGLDLGSRVGVEHSQRRQIPAQAAPERLRSIHLAGPSPSTLQSGTWDQIPKYELDRKNSPPSLDSIVPCPTMEMRLLPDVGTTDNL